jgi:glycosyltransferase involved in cell wall biosynthesis
MIRTWLEWLFDWPIVRWLAAFAFLARAQFYRLIGQRYRAISDLCWIVRVSRVGPLQRVARGSIQEVVERARRNGRNELTDWFRQCSQSRRSAAGYALSGAGPRDLFRDLMVLKATAPDEKGVILLKYGRTFEAVIAMFDFPRLFERYAFVLEPCWAGYCDPAILMYFMPGHPVIVQCFTEDDYAFIEGIGPPFRPLRLGPADWVNADVFNNAAPAQKIYDLVMVANWGAHKRHAQLFRALGRIRDRDLRVLLVGFPWAQRTHEDIRREARLVGSDRIHVEIVEKVSHAELARLLVQCKAFVFLSRKEGDNKALVEAMFADVPAVVYDRSIGGARSRVNPETGILASDEDLASRIRYMLDHAHEFHPRTWALEHTGSSIATRTVDAALSSAVREAGGRYTRGIVEKTNAPNLAYRDPAWRNRFQADYDFVLSCLRSRPAK